MNLNGCGPMSAVSERGMQCRHDRQCVSGRAAAERVATSVMMVVCVGTIPVGDKMAVPDFQTLMLPVLQEAVGGPIPSPDLTAPSRTALP